MQRRKALYKIYKQIPDFSERKALLLDDKMRGDIERQQGELNSWLRLNGRPELKLSLDEIAELIVGD